MSEIQHLHHVLRLITHTDNTLNNECVRKISIITL